MAALGKILMGAMSGTSADGVDVAAVSISGRGLEMTAQLLQFVHLDYPADLKQRIFRARNGSQPEAHGLPSAGFNLEWQEIAALTRQITEQYIAAIGQIDLGHRSRAAAIAAHGQTFFHEPPSTLQLLDAPLLANRTACAVVSDFRRADCAAGGQGAPLVPFADYLLFRHPDEHRILLNIGGIANITWLPAGGSIDDVIAFDTGPGNCVSDWLCRQHDPNGPGFDAGGALAMTGNVNEAVCAAALNDPYLQASPPKSTDTAAMLELFHRASSGIAMSFPDALATACTLTARTITSSLSLYAGRGQGRGSSVSNPVDSEKDRRNPLPTPLPAYSEREVVVLPSGGGVLNQRLMQELRAALDLSIKLETLPTGMSQAKEAIAFALLGAATLDGEPSNVPGVTGATRRVILASVTPKP